MNAYGSNAFPLDFAADAVAGRLPQVSWLNVGLTDTEHPPAPTEWGQDVLHTVLTALFNSPQWPKTALIFTYDENGGFFDHVAPPTAPASPNPLSAGEYLDQSKLSTTATSEVGAFAGGPVGLGFRVPTLVISPFSRNPNPATGPMVCSDTFDHTSILRFLERVFGVPVPRRNPTTQSPGLSPWREATTGDLTAAFNFAGGPLVSAVAMPQTNHADPRVLAECPAPAGTLANPAFSTGYPVPATTPMPAQEALPPGAAVQRPSGPVPDQATCPPLPGPSASPSPIPPQPALPNTRAGAGGAGLLAGAGLVAGAAVVAGTWWERRRRTVAALEGPHAEP